MHKIRIINNNHKISTSSAEHHPHSGSARHSACDLCLGQADSGSAPFTPPNQPGITNASKSPILIRKM